MLHLLIHSNVLSGAQELLSLRNQQSQVRRKSSWARSEQQMWEGDGRETKRAGDAVCGLLILSHEAVFAVVPKVGTVCLVGVLFCFGHAFV